MKTFMILIAIVLPLVAFVAYIYTWHKKKRKSLYNQLNNLIDQNPRYKLMKDAMEIMAQNETSDDKVPGAYGEFGYDATNPIPTKGIPGRMAYLATLRTEDGVKVEYSRKGHTRAENVNHPIDMYEIRENGERICMLYLCPYYKENSAIAPKGFKLLSTE